MLLWVELVGLSAVSAVRTELLGLCAMAVEPLSQSAPTCLHNSLPAAPYSFGRPHRPAVLPLRSRRLSVPPPTTAASPRRHGTRLRFPAAAIPCQCLVRPAAGTQCHRAAGRDWDVRFR